MIHTCQYVKVSRIVGKEAALVRGKAERIVAQLIRHEIIELERRRRRRRRKRYAKKRKRWQRKKKRKRVQHAYQGGASAFEFGSGGP